MIKRALLIVRLLLIIGALVYLGVIFASELAPLGWGTPLCGRWIMVHLRPHQLEVGLFTPDDKAEFEGMKAVAALQRFQHSLEGGTRCIPDFRPFFKPAGRGYRPWQWQPDVPGGIRVECDSRRFDQFDPPLEVMVDVRHVSPQTQIQTQGYSTTSFYVPGSTLLIRGRPWALLVAMLAYPALWTAMVIGRRCRTRIRLKQGLCQRCGYNLTGLPQPRCPECGTEFNRPVIAPQVSHV